MPYASTLPYTGGGLALGSVYLGFGRLAVIALAAVLVGALLVRLAFRRGKAPADL